MSVNELRETYTNKVRQHARGVDQNIMDKIWSELIASSGWTFLDAMEFIQQSSQGAGDAGGDAKIAVFLSVYLSHNNLPWKYWFFQEFPLIARQLNMDWRTDVLPYPWLQKSIDRVHGNKRLQHEDDVLFFAVPWRSCYMWTRMFVRMCDKYYADYTLRWDDMHQRTNLKIRMRAGTNLGRRNSQMPRTPPLEEARKSVTFVQKGGRTYAEVDIFTAESKFATKQRMLVDTLFSRRYGLKIAWIEKWLDEKTAMFRAYMAFRYWIREVRHTEEQALREEREYYTKHPAFLQEWPNVGNDGPDVANGKYEYNFTPTTVESFIRWYLGETRRSSLYVGVLTLQGGSEFALQMQTALLDEMYGEWPNEGRLTQGHLHEGNVANGFVVIGPEIGQESWWALEQLDVCPRRITNADPEKRAVQFLGVRDLGE